MHARIHLVDRLDIGLIGVGRDAVALERRHVAEEPGNGHVGGDRRGHRGVAEIAQRADAALGGLHREIIGNAGGRVGPEIRRDLLRRAEADVDIGRDRVGVEAELRRPRAIDGGVERGRIDLLLEMRIGDPGNGRNALPQLLRDAQVRRPVVADGAHVDLRRQPEIEDLGDDIGSLEIEHDVGKRCRQHSPQLAHVVRGRRMAVFERHQDHAVIDPDGRAVGERQVVRARGQPDIVDDQLALVRWNNLADLVLYLLKDALGRLDA